MPRDLAEQTLTTLLQTSVANYHERPALSNLDEAPLTYQELGNSVHGLSHWLAEQGIAFGDKVAILGENSPNWGIAYLAVTTMGAVAIPVLTEFHADAVGHIIRHSEAKLVFVSEKLFPKLEEISFDAPPLFVNLETFVPLEQGMTRDTVRGVRNTGMREFRKWMEKTLRRTSNPAPQTPSENDLAAIIYTSGTTGHSKGVMLTHKNIVSNSLSVGLFISVTESDRLLSILPLAHAFECTLGFITPLLHGAHVCYLNKPPTARVLLPALAIVKPTIMLVVPLVMEKIYKNTVLPKLTGNWLLRHIYSIPFFRKKLHQAAGKKLKAIFGSQLWTLAIGGAPLAADAERFLSEARFPYTIGYGLTECAPLVSATAPKHARLLSAGKASPGTSIRIADVNQATGEGEIQAFGDNVMKGYYKAPEITADVFTEDGWFKTGDLGYMDTEGYVYIKGRSKNMVLGPNGENIYPEEVESIFFASPFVAEVLVYQQNGKLAARVHLDEGKLDEAFAELTGDDMPAKRAEVLENIRQNVNAKVSSFARIHRIYDQPEPFEKTPTHKIKRYLYVDGI